MSRPRIYHTEAIVLRTSPLGEADRLLTVFSPGIGKLRATARGVRKPTSRLGGHLDPLTRSMLTLTKGQSLDTITGADARESFPGVKSDLGRLSRAIYLVELVDLLNPLEVPSPGTYSLFLEGLRGLGTGADADLILRYLELQLLGHGGFLPELRQCAECHGQISPRKHFLSPAAGGVLCPACRPSHSDAMSLSLDALKVLRFISTATMASAIQVRVNQPLHRELGALLHALLRYTLERELRSVAFLRSVNQTSRHARIPESIGRTREP